MDDKHAGGNPAPHSGGKAAAVRAELLHSVEAVEHAVEAAERSVAGRIGAGGLLALLWGLRAAGWLALAVYFVFCLSLIALRVWWMPHIDRWREPIEQRASALLKQRVTIGRIESSWLGLHPRLQLTDVELHDASGAVSLMLPQIDAVLSWTSVPTLRPQLISLTVLAPQIEVRRVSDSKLLIAGMPIDLAASETSNAAMAWALEQRHVAVNQAVVHYYDDAGQAPDSGPAASSIDLTDVDVLLTHHFGTHYFALRAHPPPDVADAIDVRGWLESAWSRPVSDPAGWSGRLFVQLNYADLARIESFARVLPQPFRVWRGSGALRAWIDFSALSVQRARADVALKDVELMLRSQGAPLRLSSLQGRITQQAWRTASAQGQDIALAHLAFRGSGGLHLPVTDATYRISHPLARPGAGALTEISVNVLSLDDLAALGAQLPLPAAAEDLLTRCPLRGTLTDLRASWTDDPQSVAGIALRTRFDRLSLPARTAEPTEGSGARPGQPGFQNLSGSIDMAAGSGTLSLSSTDARVVFPGVFPEEFPAARLDARVHWKTSPALDIGVDQLAISSDDLQLDASGTYRQDASGAPFVDVTANLPRANAAALYRYVPIEAGAGARDWLQAALREGRISAGTLRLQGPLAAFPFAARDSGDFHASMHLSGVTLDYAPSTPRHVRPRPWPAMTGVDADLNIKGDEIEIVRGKGAVYGVHLANAAGRISGLATHDPHLAISGQGAGPLADLVQYVDVSPVGKMIGGFLDNTRAGGPGRLQIKLDIPLNHATDTQVDGSVFFQGNDVVLRTDLSPLTAVSGRLDFDQHGIRIPGISAGFVGGQAHITAETKDGAVSLQVVGTATPQGVRRQIESSLVRQLLDHVQGTARYTAALTIRGQALELHVSSDLLGLTVDLPPPLAKSATDALALNLAIAPAQGVTPPRESVHVTAGQLVDVQLERVADPAQDGALRIDRGVISIGAPGALPETGLLLEVSLTDLDADRWLPLLETASEGGSAATSSSAPSLVAVHVDKLLVSGKLLDNVVLGASRTAEGAWNANIGADQTSGSLSWMPGPHSAPGRLTARLAHLVIPEGASVTEVLDAPSRELPELDVVADDFVLGSTKLGHLELDAQNSGGGRTNVWQLKRLQIDNPDGHVSGVGQWQREPGTQKRKMTLAITLDIVNAGNLLGRFGLAGVLRNGAGKFTADLAWLGSPFSIDYATLSGTLLLNAQKGQFLKADPGVARLLGVMSLQSLPRRITLDFRDVFSKGFAFDTLHATAQVANGVLTTHDFKMIGVDASVLIEGETDLRAETQNLHVLVLPEISATSASVLYAFLANPAIGIGTFLAQWVLRHPLSKIFSFEYDVTGSWAEPQVKRHERAKPEAPAPGAG
ncbi:MAG: TIGR02099 family protein [Burkholderiaceae bacterium]|nr:TIGR02099 family protein [Burkholderiaceae bacterium]